MMMKINQKPTPNLPNPYQSGNHWPSSAIRERYNAQTQESTGSSDRNTRGLLIQSQIPI
jgi:hypothetical protein